MRNVALVGVARITLRCSSVINAILSEELLRPESTLPEQFQTLWNGSRPVTPERALAVGVLWQAADDLRKYRYARRRKRQRLYVDAYNWVASNDRTWPYAFVSLCEALNLSPQCLRAELLDASVHAVDEAA